MQQTEPSTPNRIEELRNDHRELIEFLQSRNQLSLRSRVEDAFGKTLVVAVASYFEVRLTQIILDLYRESSSGTEPLVEFVRNQAIGTRFAQLFNWREAANANSFYRLFGDDFTQAMRAKIGGAPALDASVKAFLEIGHLRNQMVHRNFADFQLTKTVDEVYSLYQSATLFLDEFPVAIREAAESARDSEAAQA